MKIGSLVECIKPFIGDKNHKPLPKGYYTIRQLDDDGCAYVEEIINKECYCRDPFGKVVFSELGYHVDRFREIEFPPSIEAEIKECLTREFELV